MSSESRIAALRCWLSSRISSSISRRTDSMSFPRTCEMNRANSPSSACGSISSAASHPSAVDGTAMGLLPASSG